MENLIVKSIPFSQIRRMIPLHLLPQKDFKQLCSDLVIKEMEAGGHLFMRGDQDSAWIYLLEGTVALETDGILMDQIEGGTEAARFALAHQVPRKVSGRALTKLRYIRIDQQTLEFMEQDQDKTETIFEKEKTGKTDDWMGRLFKLSIFQQLPASNLQRILQRIEEVEVSSGTRIIEQGEEADCVYVLSSGRCMATRRPRPNAKEFKLGEILTGDLFGEDALISGLPRAVSVTMESDGSVQRLSKEDFIELVVNPVLAKVSLESAMSEVEQGAIWLDVRDPDAYQKRHFEDSLNVPFFSMRMQLGTLDRKRRYITLCENGNLSSAAAFLLMRYGFEASVLEGGLIRVPEKCLLGCREIEHDQFESEMDSVEDQLEPAGIKDEAVVENPSGNEEISKKTESILSASIDIDRLKLLEKENEELVAKVGSLEAQIKEMGAEQMLRSQLEQQLEYANAEIKRLEEQSLALENRIGELEAVIEQYVEAAQFHGSEEGNVVQSLRAELQMVREQAESDVDAMRRELVTAKEQYERLQAELKQKKNEETNNSCFLPADLQPVDPQQLPLHDEIKDANKTNLQGVARVQSILWCLVGVLASFSLLGIGIQTETGKRWLAGWMQDGSGPVQTSSMQSSIPVAASASEAMDQEAIFAEDPGEVILEEAPTTYDAAKGPPEDEADLFAE